MNNKTILTSNDETTTTKRSSLSSRASKIPQKIAQSTLFTLKASTSTLIGNNSNGSLSTRLGNMFFRTARPTHESVIRESRSFSTSLDFSSSAYSKSRDDFQSKSLDITYDHNQNINNDLTTRAPNSISSPERTDFDSYYHTTAGSVNSPLSFSSSPASSIHQSTSSTTNTPTMSPFIYSSLTTTNKKSVKEYANILIQRCQLMQELTELQFTNIHELETIVNQVELLVNATKQHEKDNAEEELEIKEMKEYIANIYHSTLSLKDQEVSIKSTILDIQAMCQKCVILSSRLPLLSDNTHELFKRETTKVVRNHLDAKDYKTMKSDQLDEKSFWLREFFVGRPYVTFIGSLNQTNTNKLPLINAQPKTTTAQKKRNSKNLLNSFMSTPTPQEENKNLGIISVIQERASDDGGKGNGATALLHSQYRILVRSKEPEPMRYIVHESLAKDTLKYLESKGQGHKMDKMIVSSDLKRLRPFGNQSNSVNSRSNMLTATTVSSESQNTFSSRMIRAAILSVLPNIDLRSFKEMSAESTILAGLEKELLKYDEIQIPKHYKFGLLTIKNNQTTEEAWFSNTGLSTDLKHFLNIMGTRIELKGYTGYSAGLDTKTGESGEYAYVSKWNDFDIMYHVAPIMPSQSNDKQQVLRKKHIGNDIVCIVYLEGDQLFNPKAIRSQFLHVYIIVRREVNQETEEPFWRVEVLANKNVSSFGPALPSPPLFHDDDTLKEFLTLKLISAENAALKSEKFRIPNSKARIGLLNNHIDTGLSFTIPHVVRSASANRLQTTNTKSKSSSPLKKSTENLTAAKRPKSVNNSKSSHQIQNSRLLREAMMDEEKRRAVSMASTDIPPMPTASRSTLLQDFKNNFTRKKTINNKSSLRTIPSDQQQYKKVSRKTSQLIISSIPEDTTTNTHGLIDKEDMFVGKDIIVSSESFISTEQLFSLTNSSSTSLSSPPSFVT